MAPPSKLHHGLGHDPLLAVASISLLDLKAVGARLRALVEDELADELADAA
jgi:hypothetical protein